MESYWDSLVEATGNSYESGAGVEFDDLPESVEPLVLLGHSYSTMHDRDDIRHDFTSRLWVTYRRDFPPIGGSEGPRSDKGWGCMLRCGQMALAEAVLRLQLGRRWRWAPASFAADELYRRTLLLFEDNKAAAFSIHQIASMGVSDGKPVGQWFGPNTVAQAIKKLSIFDKFANLLVHVALDNTVVIEDLKTLIRSRGSSQQQPLLLFIPLRLGLCELNPQYVPALKRSLELAASVGFIGGKPNHAHYFVGYQGGDLYYLDPHTTQDCAQLSAAAAAVEAAAAAASAAAAGDDAAAADAAAAVDAASAAAAADCDASYHCRGLRRMQFARLDPSLALGFVCSGEAELDCLCADLVRSLVQPFALPLFEVQQQRPPHWPRFQPYTLESHVQFDSCQDDDEDDNYVLV